MATRSKLAAETLWGMWQVGATVDRLPESCSLESESQGRDAQLCFAGLAGTSIRGWKIAASSEGGQKHINVDGPLEGPYFEWNTHESGVAISIAGNHMAVAEAEFAFCFGDSIAPRDKPYEVAEVLEAVSELRPSLELPDSRFTDFTAVGAACLLADCAAARDCVLGEPAAADWRSVDLSESPAQLVINGQVVTQGTGRDALGDPRKALTWVVNRLSERNITIKPGQFVTTGVCGKPMPIQADDVVVSDLGIFGTATATLTQPLSAA